MPFFQDAKNFEIKGGNFTDLHGDQHNHRTDNSFTLSGTGNTANLSPNLSRQDNRTYNLGNSNTGLHGYHSYLQNYGVPQNFVPPQLDPHEYHEYQMFLAWRQQLQITGQPMNDLNAPRGLHQNDVPTDTRPNPQFGQHYLAPNASHPQQPYSALNQQVSGSHYTHPPSTNWGGSPFPDSQPQAAQPAEHPSHNRSQSQPLPNHIPAQPSSEASEVLSGLDSANPIPGFGAMLSLQDRFSQQLQSSGISAQQSQSPHPTSAAPTPSRVPVNSQMPSLVPPQPASTTPASSIPSLPATPVQMPPSVNLATKPSTPQPPPAPSLPDCLPAIIPALHLQSTSFQSAPLPHMKQQKSRPSSSISSSSSSSDGESSQNHSMLAPVNASAVTSLQAPNPSPVSVPVSMPSSSAGPPQVPPTSVATPPTRHETESPLSAAIAPAHESASTPFASPSMPVPSPAPVAPLFSAFPNLRPLDSSQSVQLSTDQGTDNSAASSKKKKKTFLQKFGLGRKKRGEETS